METGAGAAHVEENEAGIGGFHTGHPLRLWAAGHRKENMGQIIDGKTAVYGLIGNPVAHSFSPLIHNTLAEGLQKNLVYTTFPVAEEDRVGDSVKGAYSLGIQGMNVTVPYKSKVIPFLAEIDPIAKAIGAVNTLVRTPDGYKGYNTDYRGLRKSLEENGLVLSGMRVVLIGAGGAARAVGFMCGEAGVSELLILNRTLPKAQLFADELGGQFPSMKVHVGLLTDAVIELEGLKAAEIRTAGAESSALQTLAIQGTNVGMSPDIASSPVEDPAFFNMIDAAYDCVYNPEETKFLRLARAAGKPAQNGIDMLLWQGILAFEYWTGIHPDEALTEEVRKKLHAFIREQNG